MKAKIMKPIWWLAMVLLVKLVRTSFPAGHIETYHNPTYSISTPSRYINDTGYTISPTAETPDFRLPEPPYLSYNRFFREDNRPIRISPHRIILNQWYEARDGNYIRENPHLLGCYCCTVFKRLTPLAGCAVITTRHILTTATSTEMILKLYRHSFTLENILGAWYENDAYTYNSSMYMTPARIFYHPRYSFPGNVNVSHPIPCIFDLAVWTSTYRFYGGPHTYTHAIVCQRGSSHWYEYSSSTPRPNEMQIIVGYQLSKGFGRNPMPWFKYALKTYQISVPCPKVEWGWFHCIYGRFYQLGIDSGAAQHRALRNYGWRYDGLIGLCAFSMLLRSQELTHYFTPVDTHPVLEFLVDAYNNNIKKEYNDKRFKDEKGKTPEPYPQYNIPWVYEWGKENYWYAPYWKK